MATDYQIVEANFKESLELFVKSHLRSGWVISGGVSSLNPPGIGMRFYQAMTQEITDEELESRHRNSR